MTDITLGGVLLPNASKINDTSIILANGTVMASGKTRVQSTTNTGYNATFRCLGTNAQFLAILALAGTSCTLVTSWGTYTKCYLTGNMKKEESDNPNDYFFFDITLIQETV